MPLRRTWRARLAPLVGALLLVAAACGDDGGGATPPSAPSSSSSSSSSTAPSPSSSTTAPPADRLGAALDEMLGWLADPSSVDAERFSPSFLAAVPPEQLEAVFTEIGGGRWAVVGREVIGDDTVVARLEGDGPAWLVQLGLDEQDRIGALRFQLAELPDPPASLDELVQRLAESPRAGFLRADVDPSGACVPAAALRAEEVLPIGSVFKLYVLAAVADAVSAGQLRWDEPVAVRDALDSLPTGITQDEPDGTAVPVRELALRMIEISDNTATDHLIDLVGREAVEAQLAHLGHHDPTVMTPLLTTREWFTMEADPALLDRYVAAGDDAARRRLLAEEVAAAPLPAPEDLPIAATSPTTVGWFATPLDVCRALVALDDLAADPALAPIREILGANPGLPVDPAVLPRVLHKGGSEPGVLFAAWLAARPDGSRLVVAGGVVDETNPVDPLTLQLLGLGLTLS